jgi:hypothetical protein
VKVLVSQAAAFGRLWYAELGAVSNAIGYVKHRSRSHHAVIRVYDAAGDVIATHEHAGDFKRVVSSLFCITAQADSMKLGES